jgi:hypothetical protein
LFTLIQLFDLKSMQIDFDNAFAQASLDKPVYIELPEGYYSDRGEKRECVLELHKSLYGMKDASKRWYDHLRGHLLSPKYGFRQSKVDPCLYINGGILLLTWVDDVIIVSRDRRQLDELYAKLEEDFEVSKENNDTVESFLGIDCNHDSKAGTWEFKQLGLIDRILDATGMQDCNSCPTPAEVQGLGSDVDGEDRAEAWSYPSVIGMLLYLSATTRPDISYAVHSAARHSHNPRRSHEKAVKRICRYLKGTRDKGMIITPDKSRLQVDCYCDADFAGLWGAEEPTDPTSVRSRTGFVILFAGCPLMWVSKLQTEIALSSTESEYIAMATSMRTLLPLRELVNEVIGSLQEGAKDVRFTTFGKFTVSKVYEDNNGCIAMATNTRISPRTKHLAVKLHWWRDAIRRGLCEVVKVNTTDMLADMFTKGLNQTLFERNRKGLMGW